MPNVAGVCQVLSSEGQRRGTPKLVISLLFLGSGPFPATTCPAAAVSSTLSVSAAIHPVVPTTCILTSRFWPTRWLDHQKACFPVDLDLDVTLVGNLWESSPSHGFIRVEP